MTNTDPKPFEERSTGDLPGDGDSSRDMFGGSGSSAGHEAPPERVGAYRILGAIGRGGMGTVYRAVRDDDAGQRVVAIKLVRKGVDTEDVLKRFEHEGHILNALDHPNIARFYEAGQTDDGRPYFVMEHIEGMAIHDYCDTQNLSVRRRLELFRKVCDAVHHAHTNLIVHRDLKPDNILVTPAGEPKLLDFGIAKVLNPTLARVAVVTGPAIRLMTPEYASPEQVTGQPIRTVSDVYSLGVLLYELLCGHRPYQLRSRVEQEVIRVICESDPERPSTALSRIENFELPDGGTRSITPDTVAKHRDERVDTLRRQIAGDLDDIVFKAMAKSPDRRYPSAEGMAEDILRHIQGKPVEARRVGGRAMYVARKFVRRHRTGMVATTAALLMLVIGGSVAVWQWRAAVQAERDELIRTKFAEVLWSNFGGKIADISTEVENRQQLWANVLEGFTELQAEFGKDNPIVMEGYAKALSELADVQGSPRSGNLGDSAGALANYERSAELYENALKKRRNMLSLIGGLARARIYTGDLLRNFDRSAEAIAAYEQANNVLDLLPADAQEKISVQRLRGAALLGGGQVALRLCDTAKADEMFSRTLKVREVAAKARPDNETAQRDLAVCLNCMGELQVMRHDLPSAEDYCRKSLAVRRSLLAKEPDSPRARRDVAVAQLYLGQVLSAQERHVTALRELNEVCQAFETLVEEQPKDARAHKDLCFGLHALGNAQLRGSDGAAAISSASDALLEIDWLLANTSESTVPRLRAEALTLKGKAHLALNQLDDARSILDAALELTEQQLTLDESRGTFRHRLAEVCAALGDLEVASAQNKSAPNPDAVAQYRRALDTYKQLQATDGGCGVDADTVSELQMKARMTE